MSTASRRSKSVVVLAVVFLFNADGLPWGLATARKNVALSPDEWSPKSNPSPDGLIRMKVDLVASTDGGKLQAGTTGWVECSLWNESDSRLAIPTASESGKAAGEKPRPSYWGTSVYNGFGVATLSYAYVRFGDTSLPTWHLLPPPDSPLVIEGRNVKRLWRLVTAPKEPGLYELRLKFNNAQAVEALRSCNNSPIPYPTEPLSAEGCAEHVEIVEGGGGDTKEIKGNKENPGTQY
jgi:hypothetical protein